MNLRPVPSISMLALLATSATSQTLIQSFDGQNAHEGVGRCVASAGDVNADGFADIIIGGDWVNTPDRDAGQVWIYDGQSFASGTPTLLHTLQGNSIGDFFGWSCDGAGDVDGDGYDDIVVGAYGDDPANTLDAGSVYVYSGRTWALLYEFNGSSQQGVGTEDRFGRDVAGAGDVNGDGYADIIVGAFTEDVGLFGDAGSATVFSGKDGSVLFKYEGTALLAFAGFSVSGGGDADGDGWDDVLVGVVGDGAVGTFGGTALVLAYDSTAPNNYREIRRYDAAAAGDLQGSCVADAGDVDGDLVSDHIVGAVLGDPSGVLDAGAARVYSGRDGTLLHTFGGLQVNTLLGLSVDGAGDVDGDGAADLIVGAILESGGVPVTGAAYVYSGATGQVLASMHGQNIADAFGWSVAGAGDIDQDGYGEVLVGAPFADPGGLAEGGSAFLFDDVGVLPDPARMRFFGAACPTSNSNLPSVTIDGRLALGSTVQLGVRAAPPASPAILNLARAFTPPIQLGSLGFQASCTAYVMTDGFIVSSMSNSVGVATKQTFTVPNAPQFVGANIYAQWVCADAAVTGGWVFSDALEMTLGNN